MQSLIITEVAWPGVEHRGTALVDGLDGTVYAGNTPADPMLQGALRFLATPLVDRVSTFYAAKGSVVTVEVSGTADECGVGGESRVGAQSSAGRAVVQAKGRGRHCHRV